MFEQLVLVACGALVLRGVVAGAVLAPPPGVTARAQKGRGGGARCGWGRGAGAYSSR